MIQGITVNLIQRVQTGTDEFNSPVYEEQIISVDNVLVSPTSSDDVTDQLNLTGRRAIYTLAIPKGDKNVWENQYVEFFGNRFHVFSKTIEGIESMIPLKWNKKVYVEIYEQ